MAYSFLAAVKAADAAAVEADAAAVGVDAADVVEGVPAVDALDSGASGFSSHPEVIIQRPLAFKALVMSSFHDS